MTIIQKKEKFLKYLQSWPQYSASQKFYSNQGPGIIRKIKRLLFSPSVYLPYCLWRLGLYPSSLKTQLFFGREINLSLIDDDAFCLYFFKLLGGSAELKLTKFFIKNFKENDIFYDVGANWGFYTYLALEFCKEVHSFEPLPHIFDCLFQNLINEKRCFLNKVALSNFNGIFKMYVSQCSSLSTIRKEIFQNKKELFKKEILVKAITLDEYLKTHNPPTIIKLDVEGAENLIIEVGINFFRNFSPVVAMEVWSKEEDLNNLHQNAIRLLKSFGYKCFYINEEGDLKTTNEDLSEIVKKSGFSYDNFIFRKEK